jgi:hypothetical protein
MLTLRRISTLALAAVVTVMVTGGPAHADTPEAFSASGTARALHIGILGKDATFGVTNANVAAPLTAIANGAGQLLQPNSVTSVSLSKDNSAASDPTDGKQKCAVPSLPSPLSTLLDTSLACSLAKADINGGLPHAIGAGGVATINVNANSLLTTLGIPDLKLGDTVDQVTTQLEPVLDAVSKATGNQVSIDPSTTIGDLLNALTTQQTLALSLGQATSELTTATSNLTSTSTALGGEIKLLPVAVLGNKPLATITIGSAKATAAYDRTSGKATPSFDAALVTVRIANLLNLAVPANPLCHTDAGDIVCTIAPGQSITLLEGTPLESTITVGSGTTEVNGNTAKAVADGVSLQLLKGLSVPTGASSLSTAAASGPGAVVVELAHAEALVSGTPGTHTVPANPAAPPAAEVKALAFTGVSDWLPLAGIGLLGGAWGARRLRRRVSARP